MTRRKGTPCACECDPCKGKNSVRTINNISPDSNGDFIIEAGTGIAILQTGDNSFSISFNGTYPDKPMIFKGTLGSGGDTPVLPDADPDNIGWTYLAIEDGTVPVTFANGDTLVSNGYTWVVIPSGDDPCVKAMNHVYPDSFGEIELRAGNGINISTLPSSHEIIITNTETDAIKTVNGASPDASGDLELNAGKDIGIYNYGGGLTIVNEADAIKTMNNLSPDASGNFRIAAGNDINVSGSGNEIIIDVETSEAVSASSIPIRKSDGTLLGGNPASGSTDNTLATTNWISQTGDAAPNNLVHRGGTETIDGNKSFSGSNVNGTGYFGIIPKKANFSRSDRTADHRSFFRLMEDSNNNAMLSGFLDVKADGTNVFNLVMNIIDSNGSEKEVPLLAIINDASGNVTYVRVGGRAV